MDREFTGRLAYTFGCSDCGLGNYDRVPLWSNVDRRFIPLDLQASRMVLV